MLEIWISTFVMLIFLGGITLLANWADLDEHLKPLLSFIIIMINGVFLLLPPLSYVLSQGTETPMPRADFVGGMVVSVALMGLCTFFLLKPVRVWLSPLFPRGTRVLSPDEILLHKIMNEEEAPSSSVGFRPESAVHVWAFVLVFYFIAFQLISFFLAGGLSGVADDLTVTYGLLISGFLPQVLIPVLGVGIFLRRDIGATLARLGLRAPSLVGLGVAIGSTFVLIIMVMIISGVWIAIVGEETFNEQNQASDALADSINTLGLAFMVALTAGIGEELMFRGALQPIFGFWFTAITFVVAHIQYTLTPASLIILVVAIVFGLIRKYLDTTTAMMTHFLYNFTLLVLSLASQEILSDPSWLFAHLR